MDLLRHIFWFDLSPDIQASLSQSFLLLLKFLSIGNWHCLYPQLKNHHQIRSSCQFQHFLYHMMVLEHLIVHHLRILLRAMLLCLHTLQLLYHHKLYSWSWSYWSWSLSVQSLLSVRWYHQFHSCHLINW